MPRINAMLLTPNEPPMEISLRVNKNAVMDALKQLIGSKDSLFVTTGDLGVLYSRSEPGSEANPLASAVANKGSKKLTQGLGENKGRCILLGEDEKGNVASVDKLSITKVWELFQELSGQVVKGRSASKREGPRRAKRAFDFFSKVFQKDRRAELAAQNLTPNFAEIAKEAHETWDKTLTAEEKAPYLAQAAADRTRFEQENREFLKKNPPCPKPACTAYNSFCKQNPDKSNRPEWKTMTEEQKQPYEQNAKQDLARYEVELDAFKQHCTENGRDFNQLMSSKKRKAPVSIEGAAKVKASKAPKTPKIPKNPKSSKTKDSEPKAKRNRQPKKEKPAQ